MHILNGRKFVTNGLLVCSFFLVYTGWSKHGCLQGGSTMNNPIQIFKSIYLQHKLGSPYTELGILIVVKISKTLLVIKFILF